MLEQVINLWDAYPADAKCITTNGNINLRDEAVMGTGVAKEATLRWPELPATLGRLLKQVGNHVGSAGRVTYSPAAEIHHRGDVYDLPWNIEERFELVFFPVKENWGDNAHPRLIRQSALELVSLTNSKGWERVYLPRPGCGAGRLSWEQVKPILSPLLDQRFIVVSLEV